MKRNGPVPTPPIDRLMKRVRISSEGCWLFTGYTLRGYGLITVAGSGRLAHRVSYEHHRGAIPDGLQLDHLCRVRNCVNPDHLEPVTQIENKRRSRGFIEPMHPVCIHGHVRTPDNTYRAPNGIRHCRTCNNARTRAYKARKRLERIA